MNKIKVLIIGGNGMIGSELLRSLKLFNKNLEVKATVRNKLNHYDNYLRPQHGNGRDGNA